MSYDNTTSEFWDTYLKGRPRVPESFWQRLWNYHKTHGNANFEHIHDLGSGPGIHGHKLAERFKHVTLTDPNSSLIETAKTRLSRGANANKFSYRIKSGDEIDSDNNGAFDMVIVLNALHWMDDKKCLPAIASTLKPGGTFVAALFGGLDVLDERAENLLRGWMCHGIEKWFENARPPSFQYIIQSQDSGYDCVEMRSNMWKTVKRVKLNHRREYRGFVAGLSLGLRETLPDIVSAVKGSEETLTEEDADWYFKTDLQGLRDMCASIPFPEDQEYEARMWKELGEIYQDKPVEGLYRVDIVVAQKL